MKAYLLHDHRVTINMTDQQLLVMVRRWRPTVTQPMEWYIPARREEPEYEVITLTTASGH